MSRCLNRHRGLHPSDCEVGFGRPPEASRFKAGKSGNPKGRPKNSKSTRTLLAQALAAPVAINENGRSKVIEERLALFKSLVARAIKGDARAAALVVRLMERFEDHTPIAMQTPVTVIEHRIVMPCDIIGSPSSRNGEPVDG